MEGMQTVATNLVTSREDYLGNKDSAIIVSIKHIVIIGSGVDI